MRGHENGLRFDSVVLAHVQSLYAETGCDTVTIRGSSMVLMYSYWVVLATASSTAAVLKLSH